MRGGDPQLKSRIIKWAHQVQKWGVDWQTGIYPGEMAAFLGLCELCSVRSIVESGRGEHAYSTQILGAFAEETGVEVVSIDFSPIEGKAFQERLNRYRNLRCVSGDSFQVLPKAIRHLAGPIALLIDGPKMETANRLSLVASILFDVTVVAQHNCPLSSSWGGKFTRLFPQAFHYEDLNLSDIPEWKEFKKWEQEWVHGFEMYDTEHQTVGRSLQNSSLALAVLDSEHRVKRRLFEMGISDLKHHPLALWLKWSLKKVALVKS